MPKTKLIAWPEPAYREVRSAPRTVLLRDFSLPPEPLQTSLVPIEQFLARHGIAQEAPKPAPKARAVPHRLAQVLKALRATGSRRRVAIAALVGLVLTAVAAVTGGTPRRENDVNEPSAASHPERPINEPPSAPTNRDPARAAPASQPPLALTVSLERAASDAVIEGRYQAAAALYERLARTSPERPVYREAARILGERR